MICVPITASNNNEAIKDIGTANRVADIIEIRADLIRRPNLGLLIKKAQKPIIVTNRKNSEGGKFGGNAKKRIELLEHAILLNPDFVDIELSCGEKAINNLKKIIKKNKKKTKIIISFHDFKKTNKKKVSLVFNKIKKLKPDIIKIATFANSINDNLIIFDLIKKAKKENKKIIALCMGDKGEISRILSPVLGTEFTFGSLSKGKESAPGQISAEVLKTVYRVDKLKNPKIYGLVGNPVEHSKGVIIHNKSFEQLGLKYIYVNFLVDDISSFIKRCKDIVSGLSVTIPYKRSVITHLDDVDETAKRIGAVNTVVKRNNKLVGYNTDYIGTIKSLKKNINIKNKTVLMIGAGGVARAVAFGIVKEGGRLIILNRTLKNAAKLAKEFECEFGGLADIKKMNDIDVLINCTSIGMFPKIDNSIANKKLLKKIIKRKGVVFDMVYNPVETKLLKDAKTAGLKIISGLELFINQAAAQFRLWTNKDMPNVRRLI